MQQEETAFETLKRFANMTNRKIETSEKLYQYSSFRNIPPTRRWVTITDTKGACFFGYDSSSMSTNEYSLLSGVAIPLDMHRRDFSLKLRQKSILDTLTPFNRPPRLDDRELNKEVLLDSMDTPQCVSLLSEQKVKHELLTVLRNYPGIQIEINECQLSGIPSLANENILCIYQRKWIFDTELIESLFNLAHIIHEKMLEKRIIKIP